MAWAERDNVGAASFAFEAVRDFLEALIGAFFVFSLGVGIQRGAEDLVEQDVAGLAVGWVRLRHALFELDMTLHAKLAGGRRREADEVGLHGAGDENRVGVFGPRGAEIELQLADFVAAKGEAGTIVAFHIGSFCAETIGQARHGVEGRGSVPEAGAREFTEAAQTRGGKQIAARHNLGAP